VVDGGYVMAVEEKVVVVAGIVLTIGVGVGNDIEMVG
jgi:hypothetical protein